MIKKELKIVQGVVARNEILYVDTGCKKFEVKVEIPSNVSYRSIWNILKTFVISRHEEVFVAYTEDLRWKYVDIRYDKDYRGYIGNEILYRFGKWVVAEKVGTFIEVDEIFDSEYVDLIDRWGVKVGVDIYGNVFGILDNPDNEIINELTGVIAYKEEIDGRDLNDVIKIVELETTLRFMNNDEINRNILEQELKQLRNKYENGEETNEEYNEEYNEYADEVLEEI